MNKKETEKYYINLGAPTMSLERFYISVLTHEYFNQKGVYEFVLTNGLEATRHATLKQLLSSGLKVTKKLSGELIPTSELLKRVVSYPTDYTIERACVKTAYENIGDNKFPWLNLNEKGELVFLDVFEQQVGDKILNVIDTPKPIKKRGDKDKLRTDHFIEWVGRTNYKGNQTNYWLQDELRKDNLNLWGKNIETFNKWLQSEEAVPAKKLLNKLKIDAKQVV